MQCIIFDCDGVLVDSEIITTKYFIKHLYDLGYQISIEDAIKRFTGISDKMVYEIISKETGIVFTPEQIHLIQNQVHYSLHAEVPAIMGIPELLASLEKNGTKICVASSGTLDKINKSLNVTGLIQYFHDQNIFSIQHVLKGKPAPDLFLFAAEKMGYEPKDCIVVEDSLAGIEAAIAANMRVIGFLGGSHAHYDWYKLKMNAYNIPIAHNSIELSKILKETNAEIEIKFLTECKEEIPSLATLWYEQISKHWAPNASVERAKENLIKHANQHQMPLTLVALQNGKAVGMASLRENDGIRHDLAPWLGSLVVDPNYRKQKIGERLINAIKQQALNLRFKKLYLLAFDPSIPNWYAKLGWNHMGKDQLFGHDVAVMDIEL